MSEESSYSSYSSSSESDSFSDSSSRRRRRKKKKSSSREKKRRKSEKKSSKEKKRKRHKKDKKSSKRKSSKSKRNDDEDERQQALPYREQDPELMDLRRRQLEEKRSAHLVNLLGYSNNDNPFGDSKLTEQFVWKKKIETNKGCKKRGFKERAEELEQVRKRRKARNEEREELARIKDEEARLREQEQYGDLEAHEEAQDKAQEKNRCRVRLRNNRPRLLDELYKNLLLVEEKENEDLEPSLRIADTTGFEKRPPYELLDGYGFLALEELRESVESFLERGIDVAFWEPIVVVVGDRIVKERRMAENAKYVPPSKAKVDALLQGKSLHELSDLHKDILNNRIGKGVGDEEYWKFVLAEISVAMAKARIRIMHVDLLNKLGIHATVEEFETESRTPQQSASSTSSSSTAVENNETHSPRSSTDSQKKVERKARDVVSVVYLEEHMLGLDTVIAGLSSSHLNSLPIVDELEDRVERKRIRKRVIESERERHAMLLYTYEHVGGGQSSYEEDLAKVEEEERRQQEELEQRHLERLEQAEGGERIEEEDEDGEVVQSEEHMTQADEVQLPSQVVHWHSKYKPRKPRYFNRVRTGFVWSKYNKAHYDSENPPPKSVIGYKFNIFYPDLIDKSKTPKYYIEPADSPDFAIIRFHAGPPYEDVAFKIVNTEWRTGRKTGFRCVFEGGKLQLHFQLKRRFYRR